MGSKREFVETPNWRGLRRLTPRASSQPDPFAVGWCRDGQESGIYKGDREWRSSEPQSVHIARMMLAAVVQQFCDASWPETCPHATCLVHLRRLLQLISPCTPPGALQTTLPARVSILLRCKEHRCSMAVWAEPRRAPVRTRHPPAHPLRLQTPPHSVPGTSVVSNPIPA